MNLAFLPPVKEEEGRPKHKSADDGICSSHRVQGWLAMLVPTSLIVLVQSARRGLSLHCKSTAHQLHSNSLRESPFSPPPPLPRWLTSPPSQPPPPLVTTTTFAPNSTDCVCQCGFTRQRNDGQKYARECKRKNEATDQRTAFKRQSSVKSANADRHGRMSAHMQQQHQHQH